MIKCGSFLIVLLICLSASGVLSSLSVSCDGNPKQEYINIDNKFYFIWHAKVSWFDAAHVCRRVGGDLALIESASELHHISNYLVNQGYHNAWLWTSGNNLATNRNFVSVTTGMRLPFTQWSGGQPDNAGGNEHCVLLWMRGGSFKMNDWMCRGKAKVLCQRQNHTRCFEDEA